MLRRTQLYFKQNRRILSLQLTRTYSDEQKLATFPKKADVVIIGGGSAGCSTLYHLSKRGMNAVLLERNQLTSGTTWHTGGCLWRIRPNDIDTYLLNRTRSTMIEIKAKTDYDPGWIENGGIFIAHSKKRLDEYHRLSSLGSALGIENRIVSPKETSEIFPLLDTNSFYGALHSPGDGSIDPSMLCTALTRSATETGNARVIENCIVKKLLTEDHSSGVKRMVGLKTNFGDIESGCVVNATGVWGRDLIESLGFSLPLIPMRHAYVVSEPIEGVFGMPNVRDHDGSIYFRIQGSSILMGGYENNPILLDRVSKDFSFGLYDLDWSTFDEHVKAAVKICPEFGRAGIKSTVCGPEAFTPDHKPLIGPDPRCNGLFHNCGFNSAGMMLGGGCGEQLAEWIVHGRPEVNMFNYDMRRFTKDQLNDPQWATERTHEAYVHNYSMVFPYDQPMAARNFKTDPLFDDLIHNGAVMEEKHGYERPGYFYREKAPIIVRPYDWYGAYGNKLNVDTNYKNIVEQDLTYEFPKNHNLIGKEAMACRTKAALFDLSYYGKMYLTGRDAKKAIEWICTSDINKPKNTIIYTCALNNRGGIEADLTVTEIESGNGKITNPKFFDTGFYIVSGGASAFYTQTHIRDAIADKEFDVELHDVTDKMGIVSIQGPLSRSILQDFVDIDLSDENLPPYGSCVTNFLSRDSEESCKIRLMRVSFVGELGYELHIANDDCRHVYNHLMHRGNESGLVDAGFRALYSLSCEKGYHLWGTDIRPDDTPIEANLRFICRRNGLYNGHKFIENQLNVGIHKRLVYLTADEQIPLWGLEGVYRNDEPVGFLRRADYGFYLGKSIGKAYVHRIDGEIITKDFIENAKFEIDVMGKMCSAQAHLESPFDPKNKRIHGIYDE